MSFVVEPILLEGTEIRISLMITLTVETFERVREEYGLPCLVSSLKELVLLLSL